MTSYTSSSLTLRAVLKDAAGRLGWACPSGRVSRADGTGQGDVCRRVRVTKALTLLVVPTDADVETLTSDARFFLAALEGLTDTEVERAVLPFPSHEVDPYRGLAPHFDIASARARALHALATGKARLVVASAAALLPRVSAPEPARRRRPARSRRARRSLRSIWRTCSPPPATPGRIRSTSPASSASAAASSTSTPPGRRSRSGSSSSATRSNRSAPTTRRRSARPQRSTRPAIVPLQELIPSDDGR